jgi:hypothetical protein
MNASSSVRPFPEEMHGDETVDYLATDCGQVFISPLILSAGIRIQNEYGTDKAWDFISTIQKLSRLTYDGKQRLTHIFGGDIDKAFGDAHYQRGKRDGIVEGLKLADKLLPARKENHESQIDFRL